MAVPVIDNSVTAHIAELNALSSKNNYSRIRVVDNAQYYTARANVDVLSAEERKELLEAFKSAAHRFDLVIDPTVAKAIALIGGSGW